MSIHNSSDVGADIELHSFFSLSGTDGAISPVDAEVDAVDFAPLLADSHNKRPVSEQDGNSLSSLAFNKALRCLPLSWKERCVFIKEKTSGNLRLRRAARKLATSSESGLTSAQLVLTNHDLKPVEPERRQWGAWNYVSFWISDSFNINTWMIAASMITQGGLAWWHAWLCVWIGYFIAACFVCITGRIGATYHISFPVIARSSFGIWGSSWPVANRAGMSCIWFGVQSWIGGECVTLMIRAIWPSYYNLQDKKFSGTNQRDFVSFCVFWTGSLPAIWFPVHKIRHLFTVKAFFVPLAGIAYFGWAIGRARGIGPIVHQPSTSTGSTLAWGWVNGIMSSIANFATLVLNDSDFTRFATKPRDTLWSQLFTIPCGFAFTSLIGLGVSSASKVIYGKAIWNPLDLLSSFLLDPGVTSVERFGVFMIAAGFTLAQLGTNIAANSVSAGTDLTALLPRYINIRRGGYVCAAVGLAICPWNLLSSSNNFTTYLSAYSVFLSSIAGVVISDYYLVRKGYLNLKELYSAQKSSPYYYWYGWSWRGHTAYICGIMINIVGFVGVCGVNVPIGAVYVYRFNFFGGFIVASSVYYMLCRIFPVPAASRVWCERPDEADKQFSVVYPEGVEVTDGRGWGTGSDEEATIREEGQAFYWKKEAGLESGRRDVASFLLPKNHI